ncbi:MAG: hypothetical protein K9J37_23655 [Saprospiraceae bacterium]|nr:hypothetical protein [Saprospiraceae bacterium]MCF8252923.1 hypothetical protein [Saprospiraceae bacterium]MCF8281586.1 hypothetical protein [Bacteroidales bacterium]MCF8314465.1 hypothetical protein [Saprospiraceae bacterium]MCF8443346.1 hypothetical protein [Saprospiraceae bacterium]
MNLIGNILLGVTTLIYFGLLSLVYGSHNRSGDAGVGYAFTLVLSNVGFIVCLAIVTAIIGSKGGFSWVGTYGGLPRFVWVSAGFILAMTGIFFFTVQEGLGALAAIVRQIAPGLLPLLVIVGAAVLLNDGWRATVPPLIFKLPILVTVGAGAVVLLVLMGAKFTQSAENAKAASEAGSSRHQNDLANIDSIDVMKEIVFLFVYTDANQDPELRERAIASIKSRPDWQEELVRRIQTDWAPEVFTFLASNEVDDKILFPEAVKQGALIQARLIREDIRKCRDGYDLYAGKFSWEVERVLRSVDKFEGMGVDYRPAVQELRAALDERTDFEKPKLAVKDMLDKWLKKHWSN